jgi:hypothetical protein
MAPINATKNGFKSLAKIRKVAVAGTVVRPYGKNNPTIKDPK